MNNNFFLSLVLVFLKEEIWQYWWVGELVSLYCTWMLWPWLVSLLPSHLVSIWILSLWFLIMSISWVQNLFTDDKGVATFKGIPFMTSGGPCTSSIPKASIKWRQWPIGPHCSLLFTGYINFSFKLYLLSSTRKHMLKQPGVLNHVVTSSDSNCRIHLESDVAQNSARWVFNHISNC